ncbi:MAG: RnfABCDGE type electron transport complex subunit G [Prevotellaceae bacterium]|jgi:electron transport complex protein RnfG|nr:RnfABCDGE type electron transport complex subunit G [Prevotellaceae bacterium]
MEKLTSSLKNMLLSLALISIVVAGLLAFVYGLTKEPIEQAAKQKQENAIREVTPDFNNNPVEEQFEVEISNGDKLVVFPAKQDGKLIGIAVETNTQKGFSGEIKIMAGFDMNGIVKNYSVLKHAETPGLGSKMQEWFKPQGKREKSLIEKIFGFEVKEEKRNSSVIGRDISKNKLMVTKDGGDIDAITAATVSSRAFMDALNRAYEAYLKVKENDSQTQESTE